jgi:hypothetical protein
MKIINKGTYLTLKDDPLLQDMFRLENDLNVAKARGEHDIAVKICDQLSKVYNKINETYGR